jgi:hypothetical protein
VGNGVHRTAWRAYADPVASVTGEPSFVLTVGGNTWVAPRNQSYGSNEVSFTAHEAMTAVIYTLSTRLDELNVPSEVELSIEDKTGLWERYLRPIATSMQAEPTSAHAMNDGDVREQAELKELLNLIIDAAEQVIKSVALSVKMNEAAVEAGTRAVEFAEEAKEVQRR